MIAPPPITAEPNAFVWQDWFSRVRNSINGIYNVNTKSGLPTTSDIAPSKWAVYKDTSGGTVRLWTNDNGTMKSVTLT